MFILEVLFVSGTLSFFLQMCGVDTNENLYFIVICGTGITLLVRRENRLNNKSIPKFKRRG